ncbi:MAG TPA: DUF427 domain-containing protein, partial [Acidimicrobiales bacterium]|nr:DUF427 domain-containing protein [Acidimicrobiales bacterium]
RLATARPEPEAPGHVQVGWDEVDEWYEEGERVLGHPRSPYHRIDCLRTERRLRVVVAGEVIVDTTTTTVLFETSLDPKLYVDPGLVRTDLLVRSPTTTFCPYKGTATHWTAAVAGTVVEDVAWSYEEPFPESLPIAGMLSFYPERSEVAAEVPGVR